MAVSIAKKSDRIQKSTAPRLIGMAEVEHKIGLRRSTIYQLIRERGFPAPVKVMGCKSSRWVEPEVDAFIESRIAARDAKQ